MAWFGFWLAVATYIFVGPWNSRKAYEVRHRTLQLMLEKGDTVDPQLLKQLLEPERKQNDRQSALAESVVLLRVFGAVTLLASLAIVLMVQLPNGRGNLAYLGVGAGVLMLVLGESRRFLTKQSTKTPLE